MFTQGLLRDKNVLVGLLGNKNVLVVYSETRIEYVYSERIIFK